MIAAKPGDNLRRILNPKLRKCTCVSKLDFGPLIANVQSIYILNYALEMEEYCMSFQFLNVHVACDNLKLQYLHVNN